MVKAQQQRSTRSFHRKWTFFLHGCIDLLFLGLTCLESSVLSFFPPESTRSIPSRGLKSFHDVPNTAIGRISHQILKNKRILPLNGAGEEHIEMESTSRRSPVRERKQRKIRLPSGTFAHLISRTVPIEVDWNITVWEWECPSAIVESYWETQHSAVVRNERGQLDPFGLVSWPGSVGAAQEIRKWRHVIENKTVLILGAGVGLEAQAAAMMGAKRVIATDIHPTTLLQLELGTTLANIAASVVETQLLDLCLNHDQQPLPVADVVIAADVLYNEYLASHVSRRCVEALSQNPATKILITDSQRFVDKFVPELNQLLETIWKKNGEHHIRNEWLERNLEFTGSGVIIDDDQTYDVKVRVLWVGLESPAFLHKT